MKSNTRRSSFKKLGAALAAMLGVASAQGRPSQRNNIRAKKVVGSIVEHEKGGPLFSSAVAYGNLLFIAGKGAHFDGDITAHTHHVLDELEKELVKNGSSMEKVLKVNVYLHDLADYKKMNEAYRGRFGDKPPVRTTVATYGGVPGDSLVEIDCIAALED